MSIYKNQAQRVYDHCKGILQFDDDVMEKQFNLSPIRIEKHIGETVKKSSLNGKKVADAMIKLFDQSQIK